MPALTSTKKRDAAIVHAHRHGRPIHADRAENAEIWDKKSQDYPRLKYLRMGGV